MTGSLNRGRCGWALYLLALAIIFFCHVPSAAALSCSAASPGTQNFGNVSPVSGNTYTTTGSIAVTCTVLPLDGLVNGAMIRACVSIGGSAGSTPRTLTYSSYSLQYNLYQDSAHTQVFGSVTSSPAAAVPVDFNVGLLGILLGGSATMNVPVYGLLTAGQTSAVAGLYAQSFSGTNAAVNYVAYTLGSTPACSSAWASGGSFPFAVNATVFNDCNITASNINFGSSGVLQASLYATGSIVVQCTLGDTLSIALNGGSTTGVITNREMLIQGGGTSVVHYGLFTSASYATTWGDGITGGSTVGGSTTGANQTFVVYGQVPAQSTPTAGAYADTVTATITY